MRRSRLLPLLCLLPAVPLAAASDDDADERAIRAHVEATYFAGARHADEAAASRAFHPVLVMYSVAGDTLAALPRDEWVRRVVARKGQPGVPDDVRRTILDVDVHGTAAVAKVQLASATTLTTDYLSLLKVNGQWTIVAKIFDRQPAASR